MKHTPEMEILMNATFDKAKFVEATSGEGAVASQPHAGALGLASGLAKTPPVCALCREPREHTLAHCPACWNAEKTTGALLRTRRLLDRAARELSECNARGFEEAGVYSQVIVALLREIQTELLPNDPDEQRHE